MKLRLLLVLSLIFLIYNAFAQDMMYFHKISYITGAERNTKELYKKLDSLKKTRRPNDSEIKIYFDREIDFGYKHERINLTLNSFFYQINLLTMNDIIYLSSVKFDTFDSDPYEKFNSLKFDNIHVSNYLALRNKFYKSSKTVKNLSDELNLNEQYAFNCGDGNLKTKKGLYIEKLAKNVDINKLKDLLQSINCEQQAYGMAGFKIIKKSGREIPKNIETIMKHIQDRKSALVVCNGCFVTVELPDDAN